LDYLSVPAIPGVLCLSLISLLFILPANILAGENEPEKIVPEWIPDAIPQISEAHHPAVEPSSDRPQPLLVPDAERFTEEAAQRMIATGQNLLAPVYRPLAEQIAADFGLDQNSSGIGIDIGSGPGNLIFELCALTGLHWVNADINPHFFPHFMAEAQQLGYGHRVSAVFADAAALPFRDNYANIIISRGSYPFWGDLTAGISEIMRVLKPGGVAWIGRGFARDMPVEIAREIRDRQGRSMVYDRQDEVEDLHRIFRSLGIHSYRIETPEPENAEDLNYGIWMEIHKPER